MLPECECIFVVLIQLSVVNLVLWYISLSLSTLETLDTWALRRFILLISFLFTHLHLCKRYIVLSQMIILPSLLINSANNDIKILCMYKNPSKHPSKCLQTIKSRANPKHILNKWLVNYMSLDLFSHFPKSLIFRFSFCLQAQPFLNPINFYQLLILSWVLWRNRLSWCFHAFTEINSHSLFFHPYSLPEFWGMGLTYLYFFPFLLVPMSSNQERIQLLEVFYFSF